jgi:hypothetical protein
MSLRRSETTQSHKLLKIIRLPRSLRSLAMTNQDYDTVSRGGGILRGSKIPSPWMGEGQGGGVNNLIRGEVVLIRRSSPGREHPWVAGAQKC